MEGWTLGFGGLCGEGPSDKGNIVGPGEREREWAIGFSMVIRVAGSGLEVHHMGLAALNHTKAL